MADPLFSDRWRQDMAHGTQSLPQQDVEGDGRRPLDRVRRAVMVFDQFAGWLSTAGVCLSMAALIACALDAKSCGPWITRTSPPRAR